jgi:hypothetical protein
MSETQSDFSALAFAISFLSGKKIIKSVLINVNSEQPNDLANGPFTFY